MKPINMDVTNTTGDEKTGLNRAINLPAAILLVTGIMIGSGVFKKIAPMAQQLNSESYILIVWVVAAIITLFGAFTVAGLAAMTSETGGAYEYLRIMYGDFVAYLFGWSVFTIVGSGSIAALAFVFVQSFNTLVHIPEPLASLKDTTVGFMHPFEDSGIKLVAVLVILLLTWVNTRGIKNGSILNTIVTSAKLLCIGLLIIAGLSYTGHTQIEPVTANTQPPGGMYLFSALFGAMLSALWAYEGWANVAFVTGEIKNPKRNIGLAIVGGVGIAATLYTLLNYAYMHVMPLSQLAAIGTNKIAAAEVAGVIMGHVGTVLIACLIMICTFSALNGCVITYARVYFRMAQEKAFFKNVANVSPRFQTPNGALIFSGVWSCVLVVTGTFDQVTDLIVFSSYSFFFLAALGLIKMKRKKVITAKVIGYPVIPVIIMLFCAALVINTVVQKPLASLLAVGLLAAGVPLYYYFKKSNPSF